MRRTLARRIESALVDVMEASRELERFRDPILEQAEDLEAAHDKRLSLHTRARARRLELPPLPALASDACRTASTRSRPSTSRRSRAICPSIRKWDRAAGKLARKASASEPSTRDTQLVMLAALCQQIKAWRQAEKKSRASAARAQPRRHGSSTRIRRSRKKTWPSS